MQFSNQHPLSLPTSVEITTADIDHAIAAWKKDPLDPYFTNILEAEPEGDADDRIGNFTFDKGTQRYRDQETGKFISQARVQELTKKKIIQVGKDMTTIADLLVNGKITVPTWEQGTRDIIKQLYTQQYLLGIGGQKEMTQRDYGILGQQIREQYKYLNGFAQELIANGMSEEQFKSRLQLYANASRQAFEKGKLESHQRAGYNWEKRIRTKVESCDPCIGYAAQGWVPIGTLPEPCQQCDCRANCGCYKQFSDEANKPSDSMLARWGWLNKQNFAFNSK